MVDKNKRAEVKSLEQQIQNIFSDSSRADSAFITDTEKEKLILLTKLYFNSDKTPVTKEKIDRLVTWIDEGLKEYALILLILNGHIVCNPHGDLGPKFHYTNAGIKTFVKARETAIQKWPHLLEDIDKLASEFTDDSLQEILKEGAQLELIPKDQEMIRKTVDDKINELTNKVNQEFKDDK